MRTKVVAAVLLITLVFVARPVSAQTVSDICSSIPTGISAGRWLASISSVDDLNTRDSLVYLSGALIKNGLVDATSCTDGGLLPHSDAASPCGVAVSQSVVNVWQNMYDNEIYAASTTTKVSPRLLKAVFAHESQFWPQSKWNFEYGLGHMTRSGAYTTLFWSPEWYREICSETMGADQCVEPSGGYFDYSRADGYQQYALIDRTIDRVNADCPQCDGNIDSAKAEASVEVFAWALLAHCRQTAHVIRQATGLVPLAVMDYSTLWRLSLFNYTSGSNCLYETLLATWSNDYANDDNLITWPEVAAHAEGVCQRGVVYADQVFQYAEYINNSGHASSR